MMSKKEKHFSHKEANSIPKKRNKFVSYFQLFDKCFLSHSTDQVLLVVWYTQKNKKQKQKQNKTTTTSVTIK